MANKNGSSGRTRIRVKTYINNYSAAEWHVIPRFRLRYCERHGNGTEKHRPLERMASHSEMPGFPKPVSG